MDAGDTADTLAKRVFEEEKYRVSGSESVRCRPSDAERGDVIETELR